MKRLLLLLILSGISAPSDSTREMCNHTHRVPVSYEDISWATIRSILDALDQEFDASIFEAPRTSAFFTYISDRAIKYTQGGQKLKKMLSSMKSGCEIFKNETTAALDAKASKTKLERTRDAVKSPKDDAPKKADNLPSYLCLFENGEETCYSYKYEQDEDISLEAYSTDSDGNKRGTSKENEVQSTV